MSPVLPLSCDRRAVRNRMRRTAVDSARRPTANGNAVHATAAPQLR
ncbi:hypothetical protein HMPREF0724_10955 [Prescottella equi ATCC 33707]|uniref:Uncharacterized protein n=1 Tax=Prescottella equi ATCC 33707 TaxID=525370 RepID=E9SYF3_RHOHA|nr:hypothetical protein HMPREF0724_10955 [Prescottella equi ATCC 33707]